ncbi:benzoate-CoA ligase family protein [Crossiella sp. SN42]|nr:benzoate-CoA ligase family protein [Crossiella sp. SN42]
MDASETIDYGELHRRMCAAGLTLRALGVRREERVLLVLDDSTAFPVVFLGALRIGAVPVPVNPWLTGEELAYVVRDSYANVVVVEASRYRELSAALAGTGVRLLRTGSGDELALDDLLRQHHGELDPVRTHPEDMGFWLYSSGSTGRPKGVVHRHRDVLLPCRGYAGEVLGVTETDIHLSTTKLCHAYGLGNSLLFPLHAGAAAVLCPGRPAPGAALAAIERYRPTLFFSVPALYHAMLRHPAAPERDLSSVRLCVSAAEHLPAETWRRWRAAFGLTILDGVGSTELTHIYCSARPGAVQPGSAGTPVPGYQVELRDEHGELVTPPGSGTMHVRGASALAAYWHRDERTRAALRGEWFDTGDRYRVDEAGAYWYEGRADDMLKVGGLWIAPGDIEQVLQAHPEVVEAAVVAVRVDQLSRIKAFVVPRAAVDRTALARTLRGWCRDRLAGHQNPHLLEFVEALPKTATGKLRRFALRAGGAGPPGE